MLEHFVTNTAIKMLSTHIVSMPCIMDISLPPGAAMMAAVVFWPANPISTVTI
jgi:hypothetical protein